MLAIAAVTFLCWWVIGDTVSGLAAAVAVLVGLLGILAGFGALVAWKMFVRGMISIEAAVKDIDTLVVERTAPHKALDALRSATTRAAEMLGLQGELGAVEEGLAADLIAGDPPIVDPAPFRYRRMIDGSDLGAPGMM